MPSEEFPVLVDWLPWHPTFDYLRVAMVTLLAWAWAWARIDVAATGLQGDRWTAPSAPFRRWALPEFEMRLGIAELACDAVIARSVVDAKA